MLNAVLASKKSCLALKEKIENWKDQKIKFKSCRCSRRPHCVGFDFYLLYWGLLKSIYYLILVEFWLKMEPSSHQNRSNIDVGIEKRCFEKTSFSIGKSIRWGGEGGPSHTLCQTWSSGGWRKGEGRTDRRRSGGSKMEIRGRHNRGPESLRRILGCLGRLD